MDLQRRAHSCTLNSINKRKERKKEEKVLIKLTRHGPYRDKFIYVTKSQWTSTDIY